MLHPEKKKRTHSGSRSKSKKCKPTEYSVDVRVRQTVHHLTDPTTKSKTENSSSLNKSRPSRKNSTKQKKHSKSNNREGKEVTSHSISADRKHSLTKMNRTEANYENDEWEKNVVKLIHYLREVKPPSCTNFQLIQDYYRNMKECYENLDGPLYTLCMEIHTFYLLPLRSLFQMLSPYEEYIRKKEEIGRQIDQQIFQNQILYEKLGPIDIEIFKLKEKIQEQRIQIEQKKLLKQKHEEKMQERLQEKAFIGQNDKKIEFEEEEEVAKPEGLGIGKGFKLDLQSINKHEQQGFHDEFYAKIEGFSESWRQQALRQKRF